jgi:predicted metal-dependent phosphoesterase TrpH
MMSETERGGSNIYRADLHVHSDFDISTGRWHGSKPKHIAAKIATDGNLDACVILEHGKISTHFLEVREKLKEELDIIERNSEVRRNILLILGAELNLTFEGYPYHFGYIFEENGFNGGKLPKMPKRGTDIEKVREEFRRQFPGVMILYHPTWRDHISGGRKKSDRPETTRRLMESGLVDGVETINSSLFLENKMRQLNQKALTLFAGVNNPNLAQVGASDAHRNTNSLIGSAVTCFEGDKPGDIFTAIREGRTTAEVINWGIINSGEAIRNPETMPVHNA